MFQTSRAVAVHLSGGRECLTPLLPCKFLFRRFLRLRWSSVKQRKGIIRQTAFTPSCTLPSCHRGNISLKGWAWVSVITYLNVSEAIYCVALGILPCFVISPTQCFTFYSLLQKLELVRAENVADCRL